MQEQYKFEDIFTSSKEYASRFAGPIGAWLLSVQEEAILQALFSNVSDGARMLDLGGAHGQLIEIASRLNLDLSIVASHEDGFKNLRNRLAASNLHEVEYQAITSDLFSVPAEDRYFDVVASVRLISHCEDWKSLIAEMCRLSSNLIVIDYPPKVSNNILYSLFFPIKKKLEGNTRTFTIFSHKEIEGCFNANGFRLQRRIGQFFWPMVIHRKLKSVAISKFIEKIAALFGLVYFFGNPTIAVFQLDNDTPDPESFERTEALVQITKKSSSL